MLKLSKFGAFTAQKLAQLGEKNSTSVLAVLVAFCISAMKMMRKMMMTMMMMMKVIMMMKMAMLMMSIEQSLQPKI